MAWCGSNLAKLFSFRSFRMAGKVMVVMMMAVMMMKVVVKVAVVVGMGSSGCGDDGDGPGGGEDGSGGVATLVEHLLGASYFSECSMCINSA